jgi:hypothetical protein
MFIKSYAHIVSLLLAASALAVAGTAAAASGSVTIVSPTNGQKLDVMNQNRIEYQVDPGPRGDHVHVYVDDKEVGILRQLKGSYTFESLPEGEHTLCVKVVNKAHVPIGVQQCVKVSVN